MCKCVTSVNHVCSCSTVQNLSVISLLTLSCPAGFGNSHAKTAGLHVALYVCNLGAESGRELSKGSKDMASLLVCTQIFWLGVWIFYEWHHKWRAFSPPWPTSPGPGLKPSDGSISLKLLLETRLQSESFDNLDDLLGFQVKKLWSKVIKIFD